MNKFLSLTKQMTIWLRLKGILKCSRFQVGTFEYIFSETAGQVLYGKYNLHFTYCTAKSLYLYLAINNFKFIYGSNWLSLLPTVPDYLAKGGGRDHATKAWWFILIPRTSPYFLWLNFQQIIFPICRRFVVLVPHFNRGDTFWHQKQRHRYSSEAVWRM